MEMTHFSGESPGGRPADSGRVRRGRVWAGLQM